MSNPELTPSIVYSGRIHPLGPPTLAHIFVIFQVTIGTDKV